MDIVIVGGGIIGTMHAFLAVRAGHRVVQIEREDEARGASVRNFGLVWISGRAPGAELDLALRARELWEKVGAAVPGVSLRANGSLTIARSDAEAGGVLGVHRPVVAEGAVGDVVTVLVRPEAVTVTADPNGPALVVVRTFHGAMTRLSVRLPTGDEVLADLPSPAAAGLTPGGTVSVSLVDSPVLLA